MNPERRRRLAHWLFWLSLVTTPPAMWVTWVYPKVGVVILQAVSFLALTFTAWDILQTSDVRVKQEEE